MASLLAGFWQRLQRSNGREAARRRERHARLAPAARESGLFLVLRRMRAPLIALTLIYAVSVLGLTLIPGVDGEGRPWRMGFFHAFYFMSYTATTIGFGELPHAFTDAQRMWVTFSIYLTVVGWAWAVGTLFTLLQDRGFRRALATIRFARRVRALREPFVLVAGYGQAGRRLVYWLDLLGRRSVVVDVAQERVDDLELVPLALAAPALAADARVPDSLLMAGLVHPMCAAVLALTDDDETNLAVAMTAALLRPDVRVFAQTLSASVRDRMQLFGNPTVIDPFDRFGDYLRSGLRSPVAFRLIEWMTGPPGSPLPRLRDAPRGRWVVCGHGRFGRHVAADLRAEGMEVTVIEPGAGAIDDPGIIVGSGTENAVLARARLETAVGLIAATDNDTSNLSMIAAARAANEKLYLIARQNERSNRRLFRAIGLDFALIPAEVVAREIFSDLTNPALYRFLGLLRSRDEAWAEDLLARLQHVSGDRLPLLWSARLDKATAPALAAWFAEGRTLSVGALLGGRSRHHARLPVVVLMRTRGSEAMLLPGDFVDLVPGDELLLAGQGEGRRAITAILAAESPRDHALLGVDRPAGWVWRRFARGGEARDAAR
jgi:Trk K+ transport system NAD-binding subunit